jgi:hypothetical protein
VSPERERERKRERVDAEGKKNHTYTHISVLETVLHTQEEFTREEVLGRLGWTRF